MVEYSWTTGVVLAHVMDYVSNILTGIKKTEEKGTSFEQQYILQKGLKIFGEKGYEAIKKEIGQLDDRGCFRPVLINDMTQSEMKKAQVALAYLAEKRDRTCKEVQYIMESLCGNG